MKVSEPPALMPIYLPLLANAPSQAVRTLHAMIELATEIREVLHYESSELREDFDDLSDLARFSVARPMSPGTNRP